MGVNSTFLSIFTLVKIMPCLPVLFGLPGLYAVYEEKVILIQVEFIPRFCEVLST